MLYDVVLKYVSCNRDVVEYICVEASSIGEAEMNAVVFAERGKGMKNAKVIESKGHSPFVLTPGLVP